jgi:hypothetical protein
MAKSSRSTNDVVIELSVEPAPSPASPSGSPCRHTTAALIAAAVMLLGVPAIGPSWSPVPRSSAPIEFIELNTTHATSVPEHSPDWMKLERGPLAPRWPAVLSWTGDELVVWGGYAFASGQPLNDGAAYNPETGLWRQLSPSPLFPQPEVASVWTDSELVIWSGKGSAAAWAPIDNHWREIRNWPLQIGPAIWTGQEIVDVRSGVAIDPTSRLGRRISTPPGAGTGSGIVWTGTEILMLADGVAYDPSNDSWWRLPDSDPAGTSLAGTWTGEFAVAVDYLMNSASYDPTTGSWTSLPEVPLRFSGCGPRVYGARNFVVADLCGDIGLLHQEGWMPVAPPVANHGNTVTAADGALYAWGEGFYQMSPGVLSGNEPPRRLALGVSVFDLPVDWELRSARLESPGRVAIEAVGPSKASCRVVAVHAVDDSTIRPLGNRSNQLLRPDDVSSAQATYVLNDLPESKNRLRWAASESDVIDIACSDPESVRLLASGFLTP